MTKPILSASVAEPALNDPAWAAEILALAQAAGLGLLILGRANALPFDALVLAAFAAARSDAIGIVACVSSATAHPFHAARALSALDFLSQGRMGWNPVGEAAKTADMAAAARSLWDGWDADALIIDKASGRYLHGSKVRLSNYQGSHYKVRGPLNAARPPQGHPVLVADANSPFALPYIDIAIASAGQATPAAARTLLRCAPDADPALGHYDGFHFELTDAKSQIPALGQRFGSRTASSPPKTTLRQRDASAPAARQSEYAA